jgi:hypothetical protein
VTSSRARAKRAQNTPRQAHTGGARAAPVFRGFDRDAEWAAADASEASSYIAGVTPPVTANPMWTQEMGARRRFAVPTTAARIDGDDVELDPADEDQRELLIDAEHPQYRQVLADPFSDELVEGVNPRLHVALHQVIATQLWEDSPVEVWQAAQRLLAAGYDRHAVLHALVYELGEELNSALTGQHAPDPEMSAYRDRLRQL